MELDGDSPDDRVQAAVARSRPVKDYAAALWPTVDPAKLLRKLLSEPDALARAADGLLDEDEQRLLLWGVPNSPAPPRGRSPTPCSSTRPPTWSSAPRPSVTSWSTRPRTCRR